MGYDDDVVFVADASHRAAQYLALPWRGCGTHELLTNQVHSGRQEDVNVKRLRVELPRRGK